MKPKQETMYERIEAELKGVQQALYSSRAVSTAPPSSEGTELFIMFRKKKNRPQRP
jgi:hypothetical protein